MKKLTVIVVGIFLIIGTCLTILDRNNLLPGNSEAVTLATGIVLDKDEAIKNVDCITITKIGKRIIPPSRVRAYIETADGATHEVPVSDMGLYHEGECFTCKGMCNP